MQKINLHKILDTFVIIDLRIKHLFLNVLQHFLKFKMFYLENKFI